VSHNPNLDARLAKYLRDRCKTQVDEEALTLIDEIEHPAVICEGGWHAEFLIRRLTAEQVEYLASDDGWEVVNAGDSVATLILAGFLKRFYGPLQTQNWITKDDGYEYIVYHMDINSRK